jgi:hypothetical protein
LWKSLDKTLLDLAELHSLSTYLNLIVLATEIDEGSTHVVPYEVTRLIQPLAGLQIVQSTPVGVLDESRGSLEVVVEVAPCHQRTFNQYLANAPSRL